MKSDDKKRNGASGKKAKARIPSCYAGERIQKVLAHAGMGSRREIETWIKEGRLKVNGKLATLGDRLSIDDLLQLNGRVVNLAKRMNVPTRVLIYHKPTGEVVTRRDPEGRPVIFTQLPKLAVGRWITVGRLDINTMGLLLVTTNGELANRLMHPSGELVRKYAVRVLGKVSDDQLERLTHGVRLEDGMAKFDTIEEAGGEGANHWYHVTVKEGRNRVVRRLWESQEITVSRLIRIGYGSVALPARLKARTFYELDEKEMTRLMAEVDMKADFTAARTQQADRMQRTKQPKPSRKKTGDKKRERKKAVEWLSNRQPSKKNEPAKKRKKR